MGVARERQTGDFEKDIEWVAQHLARGVTPQALSSNGKIDRAAELELELSMLDASNLLGRVRKRADEIKAQAQKGFSPEFKVKKDTISRQQPSHLDEFFGQGPQQVVVQEEFIRLPNFEAIALVENTRDLLAESQRIISMQEKPTGFQTTLTDMEVIYPWILHKTGLIDKLPSEMKVESSFRKSVVFGTQLHEADVLFNVLVLGLSGESIRFFLPNYRKPEVERMIAATEGLFIPDSAGPEEIEDILARAWFNYRSQATSPVPKNIPLAGFGLPGPEEENEFLKDPEIDRSALLLAKNWAREAVQERPMSWEFRKDVLTQREVLVVYKFIGPLLQFVARLDCISREVDGRSEKGKKIKGKVRAQVSDLKTGKPRKYQRLEAEVNRRQGQAMYVLAERFTAKYLTHYKNLVPRKEAFYGRGYHDSSVFRGRLSGAFFRHFNRESGEMFLEQIIMTEEERKEFNLWFSWYGAMIHRFRDEVAKIKRQMPRYNLSVIEPPDPKLINFSGNEF